MGRGALFTLAAIVLFVVAAVLVLSHGDQRVILALGYFGLASFAAAHFPGG